MYLRLLDLRRAIGAVAVSTATLLATALPATAGTTPPSPPSTPGPSSSSPDPTTTTTTTTTSTTLPPTSTTLPPTSTSSPTTSTTTPVATGTTTSTTPQPGTVPPTSAPATPVCRPATTIATTTTTTTLAGAATTTTTTTTTLPGAAPSTTTSTTTTVPLPECPTTTTSTTAASTSTTTVPADSTVPAADPGAPTPAPLGVPVPKQLNDILITIRLVESGNNYGIGKNRGGASGAYQYIDSTWNSYAGFPSAYLAAPHIQDERALADVQAILRTWNNDVSMVPVIWYYPKAAREPALMDQVPMPQAGNRLTVREYQHRWLEMLAQVTGDPLIGLAVQLPPDLKYLSGIPPEVFANSASAATGPDGLMLAYPVLGRSVVAPPVACDRLHCEEGTDAIVYGQKLQPVLAAADGVVTAVDRGSAVGSAVSVTITDVAGRTYRYSGFNDDTPGTDDGAGHPALGLSVLAQVGTTVRAGQIIGFMGDTDPMPGGRSQATDEAVWPHVRLTVREADGTRLDADALVAAAQGRQACHVGTGPWALPADPRLTNPDDAELLMHAHAVVDEGGDLAAHPELTPDGYPQLAPVDVSAALDGGFRIAADGTVQAHGAAALIRSPLGCEWEPPHAFGPGAAGAETPSAWLAPIELPARVWVTATVTGATPGLPSSVIVGR